MMPGTGNLHRGEMGRALSTVAGVCISLLALCQLQSGPCKRGIAV